MTEDVGIPADGPGSALKSAREALSVSEREVADALNLPLTVVEAMEANDYDNLPTAVFTRGYLRSYAKLLELDPDVIIARYPESAQLDIALTSEMMAVEPRSQGFANQPLWLRGAGIGVAAIVVILILIWLWPSAGEVEDPVSGRADAGQTSAAVDSESAPQLNPRLENAASGAGALVSDARSDPESGAENEVDVGAADAPTVQPADLPEPLSEISAATENPRQSAQPSQIEPVAAAAEDIASAQTPPGMRRISPFGDDVLSISFVQDCWVDVKDRDGNRLYGDLNRGGTTIQLIGRAPFRVLLGYAPGARMTFNDDVIEITRYTRNNVASLTVGR